MTLCRALGGEVKLADRLSPDRRSWLMSRVRSKDTLPELIVRRMVHAMGYRYRLHAPDLPGKPDLTFRRLKKIIFVHGCFWHRHSRCAGASVPKNNAEFWQEKFRRNVARDKRTLRLLKSQGWDVLVLWQCQTKNYQNLKLLLEGFLDEGKSS
ncbi:MAG: DNA mismatch endonuclease Vsr [Candidatus Hydrogenedentes bacterium]|nr:DNA mismatch endonuclease Vsr [Candidatus Hydrogenedentota bacterium]